MSLNLEDGEGTLILNLFGNFEFSLHYKILFNTEKIRTLYM